MQRAIKQDEMMLSMGEAARKAGLSKATIHRAIKAGKLSATRRDDGSYQIDQSELTRVYGFMKPLRVSYLRQSATPVTPPMEPSAVHQLQMRVALLEGELSAERQRATSAENDRDRWHEQAQRLALSAPKSQTFWERMFHKAS